MMRMPSVLIVCKFTNFSNNFQIFCYLFEKSGYML